MIMTPTKIAALTLGKKKTEQHGNWKPMEFPTSKFSLSEESEANNDYCEYRRFLIKQVSKLILTL